MTPVVPLQRKESEAQPSPHSGTKRQFHSQVSQRFSTGASSGLAAADWRAVGWGFQPGLAGNRWVVAGVPRGNRPVNPLGPARTLGNMDFKPVNPLKTLSAIGVAEPENERMLRFLEGRFWGDTLGNWGNPLEMTGGGPRMKPQNRLALIFSWGHFHCPRPHYCTAHSLLGAQASS